MSAATRLAALGLLGWLAVTPVHAVQPDEVLPDPVLEARARALSAELRCLVCQNQSIDDSAAPLARDLRLLVRERLKAGDSDAAVKAYLVSRYGQFVLLRPAFDTENLLLWLTPGLVLGGGVTAMVIRRMRQRTDTPAEALSRAEEDRLSALTGDRS